MSNQTDHTVSPSHCQTCHNVRSDWSHSQSITLPDLSVFTLSYCETCYTVSFVKYSDLSRRKTFQTVILITLSHLPHRSPSLSFTLVSCGITSSSSPKTNEVVEVRCTWNPKGAVMMNLSTWRPGGKFINAAVVAVVFNFITGTDWNQEGDGVVRNDRWCSGYPSPYPYLTPYLLKHFPLKI